MVAGKAAERPKAEKQHDPPAKATTVSAEQMMQFQTLSGDIRDNLLRKFKINHIRLWEKMSGAEQKLLIDDYTDNSLTLVREAARIIATRSHPAIPFTVQELRAKMGKPVAMTLDMARDDYAKLATAVGSDLLILLVDRKQFEGQRAPATQDHIASLPMLDPEKHPPGQETLHGVKIGPVPPHDPETGELHAG